MAYARRAMDDPLGPYRAELRAHCYRMLGSAHDAEDVLQEVSLRAWRGRDAFEGRSSLRTWLHRITTNACLNELERKERRVLPIDSGPPPSRTPRSTSRSTRSCGSSRSPTIPASAPRRARASSWPSWPRSSTCPPNQRAALLMFDVLGFTRAGDRGGDGHDAGVGATPRCSGRARRSRSGCRSARSRRRSPALGDAGQRELVERYTAALRAHDMDGMLALLTEDATWSMPPLRNWYGGHDGDRGLPRARRRSPSAGTTARRAPTGSSRSAATRWDEAAGVYRAYALDVLDVRGDRIAAVVAFLDGARFAAFGLPPAVPA